MALFLTSKTDFGQWVSDILRLEMIKLTADGDGELNCQVKLSVVMLCCVTWAHIRKKTFLRSHEGQCGKEEEKNLSRFLPKHFQK